MSTLSNQQINQSYQGLLKLENSTSGITSSPQSIQDGLGNDTGVRMGENFFQSQFGLYHYPMEPNDYYGNGVAGSQVTPTASQVNNKTVQMFYDRGVDAYSAITFNVWTQFDEPSGEKIEFAFYKLDYIETQGYVATERVSDVYSFTGVTISGGFKEFTLPSPLTFSGNGAGIYAFVIIYVAPDGTLTGRLTSASLSILNIYSYFGGVLGFVKNSLNNAAPQFWQTSATSASGQYTLSGNTLPSTLTLANYPPTSVIAGGVGAGFLLHTIK